MRLTIIIFLVGIIACAEITYTYFTARYPADKNPDITWDANVGDGKVFGTLGQDNSGLFGKGGYNREILNDDSGKLTAEAYGNRILGPAGDSSSFGGNLEWSKDQAQFGVDLNKQIGGETKLTAGGGGVWDLDKNTRITAEGGFGHTFGQGQPEIQFQGTFHRDW